MKTQIRTHILLCTKMYRTLISLMNENPSDCCSTFPTFQFHRLEDLNLMMTKKLLLLVKPFVRGPTAVDEF